MSNPEEPSADSTIRGESAATQSQPAAGQQDDADVKRLPWLVETLLIVLSVLVVVGLFQTFIGRQYVIPSGSMEPTLHGCEGCTNDRIFTEKISYYGSDPEPGDVVVFAGTDSWNEGFTSPRSNNPVVSTIQDGLSFLSLAPPDENDLVKRVIATGGQTVSCEPGDPSVMVDGKPTDQSFVMQPSQYPIDESRGSEACGGPYFGPVTVPEGRFFMMGDNRTNSADSRMHIHDGMVGTIPRENIRGKVQFIFFPFNRMSSVDDPDIQS